MSLDFLALGQYAKWMKRSVRRFNKGASPSDPLSAEDERYFRIIRDVLVREGKSIADLRALFED